MNSTVGIIQHNLRIQILKFYNKISSELTVHEKNVIISEKSSFLYMTVHQELKNDISGALNMQKVNIG